MSRAAAQLRSPSIRTSFQRGFASQLRPQSIRAPPSQRRFASTVSANAESAVMGAKDNFTKAKEEHEQEFEEEEPENTFVRDRQAKKDHAGGSAELWRKLSLYVAIPGLIISAVNAYVLWEEHWAHWDHMPPLEERTEYEYQNIRTRNFYWGDGDKTVFWNPTVNYHKKPE